MSSRLNERACLKKKKKKLGVIEKVQHAVFFSTGMQVHLPELPCAHMHTNAYIYYTHNTTHNNSNNHCPYLLATYWRCDQTFNGLIPLRPCPLSPCPPIIHFPNFLFPPTILIPLFSYPRDLVTSAILSLGINTSWSKKPPFPRRCHFYSALTLSSAQRQARLAPAPWSICPSLSRLARPTLVSSRSSSLTSMSLRSVYHKCHFIHFP